MIKIIYNIIIFNLVFIFSRNYFDSKKEMIPSISSINALNILTENEYLFLDVRTIEEHNTISIPETIVIPVQELEFRLNELNKYKEKQIVVYCRSGNRSKKGTQILNKNGFNAYNLIGGIKAWNGPIQK